MRTNRRANVGWQRRRTGFTLIEAIIVVGLIALIAALGAAAFRNTTGKARLQNALFEISALGTVAQMNAAQSGIPNYLVFFETNSQWGVAHVERHDPEPTLAQWQAMVLGAKAPDLNERWLGGSVRDVLKLSDSGGVALSPFSTSGYSATTVKRPFAQITPTASGTSSELLKSCNFCVSASGGTLGVLRFEPSGVMRRSPDGGPLSLLVSVRVSRAGENQRPKLIAFSNPAGLVKVFDP